MMQAISFDSADLPGDGQMRKERWVDSLSSGYVRLQADAKPDRPFEGRLKIKLLGQTAIGRISGTVRTIARTAKEIAAENTDNAVLLFNAGNNELRISQKGKSIDCDTGAAVLIEQCAPSFIHATPGGDCNFIAIQLPRQYLSWRNRHIEDHLMTTIAASTPALALARGYIDSLLTYSAREATGIPRFAADHVADLIAAAAAPTETWREQQSPSLRAGRLEAICRELDRNFVMMGLFVAGAGAPYRSLATLRAGAIRRASDIFY